MKKAFVVFLLSIFFSEPSFSALKAKQLIDVFNVNQNTTKEFDKKIKKQEPIKHEETPTPKKKVLNDIVFFTEVDEIVNHGIFPFLDLDELYAVWQSCDHFKRIVEGKKRWKELVKMLEIIAFLEEGIKDRLHKEDASEELKRITLQSFSPFPLLFISRKKGTIKPTLKIVTSCDDITISENDVYGIIVLECEEEVESLLSLNKENLLYRMFVFSAKKLLWVQEELHDYGIIIFGKESCSDGENFYLKVERDCSSVRYYCCPCAPISKTNKEFADRLF